ncbi:cytochrome P450 [bacterium]|nr:cytochrome P450 [bacterium]
MLPGPRGWEAVKTILDLRKDPLGALLRLQRNYGDILAFRYGPVRRVLLFDPPSVQRILQENHTNYDKDSPFYHMLGWFLGKGLITSDGELWKQQRRLIQPAFHKSRIDSLVPMIRQQTQKMISNFRRGEIIDVAAAMIELTLGIIGRALFSQHLNARDNGIGSAVEEIQRQMQSRFRSFYPLPPRFPTARDRRFRLANARLRDLVRRQIRRPKAEDILGALPPMPEEQLVDEMITLMLAGHETVATTLSWALALLSRHPDQRHNDMGRVVLETLRLFPPVGVFGRRSIGPDRLGGYAIGPGQIVSTSPYVLHRHPAYWSNPEGFDPDRFLQDPVKGSFVPFAAGPRQCIGNYLALTEATTILECLRETRLELVPGQRLEIDPQITLRPRGCLWMRVRA